MFVGAMALTGCIKMQFDFDIKADDTFDATIIMAYDEEAIKSLAEMQDMTLDEVLAGMNFDDMAGNLPDGAKAEPWSDGGYVGNKYTLTNQPLSNLGDTAGGDGMLSLNREGNLFTLDGNLDLSAQGEDLGGLDEMGMGDMMPTMQFSFTFPGPVSSSTGRVDGNTVTFDLVFGQNNVISAQATVDGAAPPPADNPNDEPGDDPGDDPDGDDGDYVSPVPADPGEDGAAEQTPIMGEIDEEDSGGLSTGLLIALIAGGVVLIAVIVLIIALARKSSKQKAEAIAAGEVPPAGYPPPGQPYGQPPVDPYAAPPAPADPYAAPPVQPYGQPPVSPTEQFAPPPVQQPYAAPPAPVDPYAAPPAQPYGQPPVAPTEQYAPPPVQQPYAAPPAPVDPYAAPPAQPYGQPPAEQPPPPVPPQANQ